MELFINLGDSHLIFYYLQFCKQSPPYEEQLERASSVKQTTYQKYFSNSKEEKSPTSIHPPPCLQFPTMTCIDISDFSVSTEIGIESKEIPYSLTLIPELNEMRLQNFLDCHLQSLIYIPLIVPLMMIHY
jgi:hypothetical protein